MNLEEVLELAQLCQEAEKDADERNTVCDDAEAYAFCLVKDTLRAMANGDDWRRVWRSDPDDPRRMSN